MNNIISEKIYYSKCQRIYERTKDLKKPRASLKFAVLAFNKEKETQRKALDLGCGVGNDTLFMIEHGWQVTAIDSQILAREYLFETIPEKMHSSVTFIHESFEQIILSEKFTLINASRSLPFCSPSLFPAIMDKVLNAISKGGRFAGHFCGPLDDWSKTESAVILTREEVFGYFNGFNMELFKEREWDATLQDKPKHWHLFSVVAQKA